MLDETQDDIVRSQIPKPQSAELAPMAPGIGIRNPYTGVWYDVPAESRDAVVTAPPVETLRDTVNAPGDRYRNTANPK